MTVGTLERVAPETADERRDAALSFGEQESLVYAALCAYLNEQYPDPDGYGCDVWLKDCGADWVVFHSYSSPVGVGDFKLSYTQEDLTITLSGEPVQVVCMTTYTPVEAAEGEQEQEAAKPVVTVRGEAMDLATRKELRSSLHNVKERHRVINEFDLREVANGTGGTDLLYEGFASVTNAEYEMEDWLGPWVESVTPGAFKKTLEEKADVAFLVNHDGLTLARTKSETLKLSEVVDGEITGLFSEARLDPKSPLVMALRSAIDRKDIDEMSFAFRVTRQEWNEDYDRRWINEVNLAHGDVSAVNYGANPHTAGTVALRKLMQESGVSARGYVAALAEIRAGKSLSASTMATLQEVLSMVSVADDNVDQAQITLSELMGVPNPDDPDLGEGDVEQDSKPAVSLTTLARSHSLAARQRLAALSA